MRYFLLTCRHKWFVLVAGLRTHAPLWRLIIHDWTKFMPAELPHYQRQFFGPANDPNGFSLAWLHHQNTHPHHWEYWIPRTGHNRGGCGDNEPLEMTAWAVREMVADWFGASRAYEGKWPRESWPWFENNWAKIKPRLHPATATFVLKVLGECGITGAPTRGEEQP